MVIELADLHPEPDLRIPDGPFQVAFYAKALNSQSRYTVWPEGCIQKVGLETEGSAEAPTFKGPTPVAL